MKLHKTRGYYDKDEIKRRVEGHELEILESVAGIPGNLLDGKHHPCPLCGGKDRFRYDRKHKFCICNQCFNTKNGDILAAIQWMRGANFPETLRLIGEYLGINPQTVSRRGMK